MMATRPLASAQPLCQNFGLNLSFIILALASALAVSLTLWPQLQDQTFGAGIKAKCGLETKNLVSLWPEVETARKFQPWLASMPKFLTRLLSLSLVMLALASGLA